MLRHNEPIRNIDVRHKIDPDIQYGMDMAKWEAAVAANATLDELMKLDNNEYPRMFVARLVAWHELHNLIAMHSQDAENDALERMRKQGKNGA